MISIKGGKSSLKAFENSVRRARSLKLFETIQTSTAHRLRCQLLTL